MKKIIALCMAGAMGLAVCGLSACGESGGTETDPADPEIIVSDKIGTDEQWDKAMRDTFTYVFDFDGEDDPTETYAEFPYWHPNDDDDIVETEGAFSSDLKLAQDRNFKVDFFYNITPTEGEGYQRQNCSFAFDMGKYHSFYEDVGEFPDEDEEGSVQKVATKFEEYLKYSKQGILLHVGKLTESKGSDAGEDPLKVWSNDLGLDSTVAIALMVPFFNYSHFGLLKEQGDPFFEEHTSVLEFAKYDEEQKGYVFTDRELLEKVNKEFAAVDETTFTLKFKDGKLIAAWCEQIDGNIVWKTGFTLTFGGQNVTFPNGLPW